MDEETGFHGFGMRYLT